MARSECDLIDGVVHKQAGFHKYLWSIVAAACREPALQPLMTRGSAEVRLYSMYHMHDVSNKLVQTHDFDLWLKSMGKGTVVRDLIPISQA